MVRELTPAAETASESQSGYGGAVCVELDFESGFSRVHSALGPIEFPDGRVFDGVGELGKMSAVEETIESKAPRLQLTISGIKAGALNVNLGTVLNENFRNRFCRGYLAFFDVTDNSVVEDPVLLFRARMDNAVIRRSGDTLEIGVNAENRLILWSRPPGIRWTNEQHQSRRPGDKFLEFNSQMVEKELLWGRS